MKHVWPSILISNARHWHLHKDRTEEKSGLVESHFASKIYFVKISQAPEETSSSRVVYKREEKLFTSFACICRRDFSQHATITEAIFSSLMASSESDTCGRKLKVRLEFPSGSQERTPPCYLPLLTCPAVSSGSGLGSGVHRVQNHPTGAESTCFSRVLPKLTILEVKVTSYNPFNSG